MDLSEQIVAAIRARNASGETYEEMAKASGVSGAQIHRLANHRASPLKMSLQTFLALFPSARIELAPVCASSVDPVAAADVVPRSEYQDLRDRYQDLRDQYQDLREQLLELRARPSFVLDGPGSHAPYHVEPSTSSSSNK